MGTRSAGEDDPTTADAATRRYLAARRDLCAAMAEYARAITALAGTAARPADAVAREHRVRVFACGHAPGAPADGASDPIRHFCPACADEMRRPGRSFAWLAQLMLGPDGP